MRNVTSYLKGPAETIKIGTEFWIGAFVRLFLVGPISALRRNVRVVVRRQLSAVRGPVPECPPHGPVTGEDG